MQSAADSVQEYLAELPADRAEFVEAVREAILAGLPEGYEEAMNWGMIVYQVPLSVVPDTYNGQPLAYVGLANQKNYVSLYLMGIYADPLIRAEFEKRWASAGLKLNAGKSCVRMRRSSECSFETVTWAVEQFDLEEFSRMSQR